VASRVPYTAKVLGHRIALMSRVKGYASCLLQDDAKAGSSLRPRRRAASGGSPASEAPEVPVQRGARQAEPSEGHRQQLLEVLHRYGATGAARQARLEYHETQPTAAKRQSLDMVEGPDTLRLG